MYTLLIIICISLTSSLFAENICDSTNRSCCEKACISFAKKVKTYCFLKAQELQACTGYTNDTVVNRLRVLNDDTTNGNLTANTITVDGTVNVHGTITLDGQLITSNEITQYGYFTVSPANAGPIANNTRVPFDTTDSANGISLTSTGVISFSEAGFYLVNFSASATTQNAPYNFQLANDPAGAKTLIPNTGFFLEPGLGSTLLNGITIIQIPTAGTTIGVLNISGFARSINIIGGLTNTIASIQIVKLADL